MSPDRNIEGHLYPPFHPGWGGFAEELFHYSSRYYYVTQSFLRNLSGERDFDMSSHRAQDLHGRRRDILARILCMPPTPESAKAVIALIDCAREGANDLDCEELAPYLSGMQVLHEPAHLDGRPHPRHAADTASPLDPLLHLAGRLRIPVAVHDRHVEIDLHRLAEQLDSPNATLRSNLQAAVIRLHDAGYVLRHHPHLTHGEVDP